MFNEEDLRKLNNAMFALERSFKNVSLMVKQMINSERLSPMNEKVKSRIKIHEFKTQKGNNEK